MEDRAGNSYYGGGGGTKRTDGEEEEEYDRRAATIRVDARKIRFVEHRVAVRLTSSEGNGVGESVRATGARVAGGRRRRRKRRRIIPWMTARRDGCPSLDLRSAYRDASS